MRALLILAGWTLACACAAAELAGVKLEDRVHLAPAGPELLLNGAGIRTRAIFKVYVGGLYLTEKKLGAAEVLQLAGPKRVSITMLRDLSAQSFADALADGMRNNAGAAELEGLRTRLDELLAIMNSLGEAKKGDRIALDWLPESGTRVVVNDQPRGKSIAGEDFYRALLRIWLGERPADADLKRGMLGQSG